MDKQDLRIHVSNIKKKFEILEETQKIAETISWVEILKVAQKSSRVRAYKVALDENPEITSVLQAKRVVDLIVDGPKAFLVDLLSNASRMNNHDRLEE